MSGFLYYFPTSTGLTPERFVADRAGIFGDCGCAHRGVSGGPDAGDGIILALESPGKPACGFYPGKQRWHQAPGQPWWIGMELAAPPSPADLARPETLPGAPVRLGDERDWTIPTALHWLESDSAPRFRPGLPQQIALDAEGKLTGRTLPRHLWLDEQAANIWSGLKISEKLITIDLPMDDEWRIAVEALRTNYRVGPEEISALGLVTTQNLIRILLALVDFDSYRRVITALAEAEAGKARAGTDAGSSTVSGETASAPATAPRLPMSSST